MQGIVPFLWFENQAEEAATFYTSLFRNSRIVSVARNGEDGPGQAGAAFMVTFELDGREYMALNGGPHYKLNPAFSLVVKCADQVEVDHYWTKLLEGGGQESMCGWLRDRYGVSWQVIPNALSELVSDPDADKAGRAMAAMLQMKKIDIAKLQQAYDG